MKKILLLVTVLAAGIMVTASSVSAVEYRLVNTQRTPVLVLKAKAIEKMFHTCTSHFRKERRTQMTSPEWESLNQKVSTLTTTFEAMPPRSAGIQLLLQILLVVLMVGIMLVFVIGTGAAILMGSLLSLIVVGLLSIVIFLFSLIHPWVK